MNNIKLLIFTLLMASTTSLFSQDYKTMYDDVVSKYVKYYDGENASSLASLYASDAISTDHMGVVSKGKENIKKRFEEINSVQEEGSLQVSVAEVIPLGNDMYLGRGTFKIKGKMQGELRNIKGYYQNLVKVENGKMKIHRHISSMIPAM